MLCCYHGISGPAALQSCVTYATCLTSSFQLSPVCCPQPTTTRQAVLLQPLPPARCWGVQQPAGMLLLRPLLPKQQGGSVGSSCRHACLPACWEVGVLLLPATDHDDEWLQQPTITTKTFVESVARMLVFGVCLATATATPSWIDRRQTCQEELQG